LKVELQQPEDLLPQGFTVGSNTQTGFHNLDEIIRGEPVKKGYGEGAFVVVRGIKS